MRLLLIGLAGLTVGVTLTVVLAGLRHQQGPSPVGPQTPPNYTLDDMLEIVSDAKTLDERRERYAVVHQELERFVIAIWGNTQSLCDAARNLRDLVLAHAPEHDEAFQSMNPAESAEEAYARNLMVLMQCRAKKSQDGPAARARYADLREQFRKAYNNENGLLPFDLPTAPDREAPTSEGYKRSSPVDCCP